MRRRKDDVGTMMHQRATAGLVAFMVWTVAVAVHYFVVPAAAPTDPHDFTFHHLGEALGAAAAAVAGAGVVLLAARGLGAVAVRFVEALRPGPLSRLLLVHAIGFQVLAAGSLLLAAIGFYTPGVMRVVIAAAAIAGLVGWTRDLPRLHTPRAIVPRTTADAIFAALAIAAMLTALVGSLAPEVEHDALWYHLWLPARWLAAGAPVDIVEEYVALYPLSWQMSYGAALAISGPGAAKLLHFACLPFLMATTAVLTSRLHPRASPWLAAALVATTPIVLWEATTAYVDIALAWYVALSVDALLRWQESDDDRWMWLGAVLLGGAVAIKHLGLLVLAIAAPMVAARLWRRAGFPLHRALTRAALFALIVIAFGAPWYLRAAAASGNPVFPDLYGVFGAAPDARWSPDAEASLGGFKARFGRERSVLTFLMLPWDVTMHGARYGGTIGPLFLLLLPAALFVRGRAALGPLALGLVVYLALWASPISSFQLRFLVPLIACLAAIAAAGAAVLGSAAPRAGRVWPAVITSIVAVLMLLNFPPFITWHERDRVGADGWLTHVVRDVPIEVAVGDESRAAYLARMVPSYAAWQYINATLPADGRVLTFSGGDHLYSARPRVWSDAWIAHDAVWGAAAGHEAQALAALRRLGITHVLFDRRQLESGTLASLAIAQPGLRACCLIPRYEDAWFALYELRTPTAGAPDTSARRP